MKRPLAAVAALALASCATMERPMAGVKPPRTFSASLTLVEKDGACVLGDKTTDIRAHSARKIVWQVYSDCPSSQWVRFVNWKPERPPCIAPQRVNEEIPARSYVEFRRNVVGQPRAECSFDVQVCDGAGDDAGCTGFDPRILIEN